CVRKFDAAEHYDPHRGGGETGGRVLLSDRRAGRVAAQPRVAADGACAPPLNGRSLDGRTMSLKEIEGSIDQLRTGIDAVAVVLVDRSVERAPESPPDPVAEALGRLACLRVDWGEWYRDL